MINKTHWGYDARDLNLVVKGYSGNNEVLVKCPSPDHSDHNPSASFNTETGLLYCFSCGYSANIAKLQALAGVFVEKKPTTYSKPDSEQLWKDFYKFPEAYNNEYLKSRQVYNTSVSAFDIRWCHKGIVFLFKDRKGKMVGCQMRQFEGKPKYLTFGERILFSQQLLKRYTCDKPIYLTEGIFGAIRGYQSGFQTLATIGAMIKESALEPIVNWPKIYGVFDNDLAGEIAACRLLKFIPTAKIILGATADEMSSYEWENIHDSYLTTRNILDIIRLSKEPDKLRKYV